MKTKVISILVFIVLLSGCSTIKKEKNDLKKMNLKGKVRSIREFYYKAVEKSGEILKGKIEKYDFEHRDTYIIFNNKGNGIEENAYNADGSFAYKWTCKYDNKGNQIETNDYDSDGKFYKKWIIKYKYKWNKIETNVYNSDGSFSHKWILKYDYKGNQIEQNNYRSDGSLVRKWVSKYDDKGNQIEENAYNSDGSLGVNCNYEYEYDEKNNWIKKIIFENKIPEYILERKIEYYH